MKADTSEPVICEKKTTTKKTEKQPGSMLIFIMDHLVDAGSF